MKEIIVDLMLKMALFLLLANVILLTALVNQ